MDHSHARTDTDRQCERPSASGSTHSPDKPRDYLVIVAIGIHDMETMIGEVISLEYDLVGDNSNMSLRIVYLGTQYMRSDNVRKYMPTHRGNRIVIDHVNVERPEKPIIAADYFPNHGRVHFYGSKDAMDAIDNKKRICYLRADALDRFSKITTMEPWTKDKDIFSDLHSGKYEKDGLAADDWLLSFEFAVTSLLRRLDHRRLSVRYDHALPQWLWPMIKADAMTPERQTDYIVLVALGSADMIDISDQIYGPKHSMLVSDEPGIDIVVCESYIHLDNRKPLPYDTTNTDKIIAKLEEPAVWSSIHPLCMAEVRDHLMSHSRGLITLDGRIVCWPDSEIDVEYEFPRHRYVSFYGSDDAMAMIDKNARVKVFTDDVVRRLGMIFTHGNFEREGRAKTVVDRGLALTNWTRSHEFMITSSTRPLSSVPRDTMEHKNRAMDWTRRVK